MVPNTFTYATKELSQDALTRNQIQEGGAKGLWLALSRGLAAHPSGRLYSVTKVILLDA